MHLPGPFPCRLCRRRLRRIRCTASTTIWGRRWCRICEGGGGRICEGGDRVVCFIFIAMVAGLLLSLFLTEVLYSVAGVVTLCCRMSLRFANTVFEPIWNNQYIARSRPVPPLTQSLSPSLVSLQCSNYVQGGHWDRWSRRLFWCGGGEGGHGVFRDTSFASASGHLMTVFICTQTPTGS